MPKKKRNPIRTVASNALGIGALAGGIGLVGGRQKGLKWAATGGAIGTGIGLIKAHKRKDPPPNNKKQRVMLGQIIGLNSGTMAGINLMAKRKVVANGANVAKYGFGGMALGAAGGYAAGHGYHLVKSHTRNGKLVKGSTRKRK